MPLRPKADHTQLLCDVSELTALFTDAASLDDVLHKITALIAKHMHCPVCSIYFYDDRSKDLVLKTTYGLNPRLEGKVRLKLGEGLTGMALKEMRPICVADASRTEGYRYVPELGEEAFESFLAVPILRGLERIGVVVVQSDQTSAFNESDVTAVRAITSQLASLISTARLLIQLHEQKAPLSQRDELATTEPPRPTEPLPRILPIQVGAGGLAQGRAYVHRHGRRLKREDFPAATDLTWDDFLKALVATEEGIERLQKRVEERLVDAASLIFTAHILMLKDAAFKQAVRARFEQTDDLIQAVIEAVQQYADFFSRHDDDLLREKAQDILDVGQRLLATLTGQRPADCLCEGRVIIAPNLFPSELLGMAVEGVAGIVLLSGGVTSHLSILARSLGQPLGIAAEEGLLDLNEDDYLILDGYAGRLHINPDPQVITEFKKRFEDERLSVQTEEAPVGPVRTKDGQAVILRANINLISDCETARHMGAQGVGLYRSEFPFIVRADFPSEEEQFAVYTKLFNAAGSQPVVFRTLDIGGDKEMLVERFGREPNPFLGMRSLRFTLAHPHVFRDQVRAFLRAGAGHDARLVFPMVGTVEEFLQAKDLVLRCRDELRREGVPCHESPLIGAMIEVPSLLFVMNELLEQADFISIGTNDLVQYLLAVDRTNERVADHYQPAHPSVLRALAGVVSAAKRHGKPISVCGDMAHDVTTLPLLIGLGVREFSVNPRLLPLVRRSIQQSDAQALEDKLKSILIGR